MADPFVGQIMVVPYTFAPVGWAFCQGQLLPISQNTALFSLLGTQYGGNGTSTFALPNLQGNIPIGQGTGPGLPTYAMGETGGVANVTLLTTEIPAHSHVHQGVSAVGTTDNPVSNNFGELKREGGESYYVAAPAQGSTALMNQNALQTAGGSQAHSNLQPYLVLNYVIALRGVFPTRS
jgi:microcystin-dependent protein